MSFRCAVTTEHGLETIRCILTRGHAGPHIARDNEGGPILVWPPSEDPPITQSDVTLDELLEHLHDLEQLAAAEGYRRFAMLLEKTAECILEVRPSFERVPGPPVAPSSDARN